MSRTLSITRHFKECKTATERMVMAIIIHEATTNGHGDEGPGGIAEFGLMEFSEATLLPPGEGLRLMKSLAERTGGLCVVNDTDLVLFAINGGIQSVFERLYVNRGFGENPPRLPKPNTRVK